MKGSKDANFSNKYNKNELGSHCLPITRQHNMANSANTFYSTETIMNAKIVMNKNTLEPGQFSAMSKHSVKS